MNKYYEWKVLTDEGRLIDVPPEKSYISFDIYLTDSYVNEHEAVEYLNEWLKECDCKVPENLTLVSFYN